MKIKELMSNGMPSSHFDRPSISDESDNETTEDETPAPIQKTAALKRFFLYKPCLFTLIIYFIVERRYLEATPQLTRIFNRQIKCAMTLLIKSD